MHILLTGATGFLGSHLLMGLLERGFKVTILKRSFSSLTRIEKVATNISYYNIDQTKLSDVFVANQFDVVIHTATSYGHQNLDIWTSNVEFPMRLVECCKQNDVPVFINTDSYFAKSQQAELLYLNDYINTKIILARELRKSSEKSSLQIINMRLEHVFGEGDSDTKFTYNIVKQLLKHESSIALTYGEQKRDFIYVEDVVRAYLAILYSREMLPRNSFVEVEVGIGQSMSIREFVELAAKMTQSSSDLHFGKLPYRKGEIMESVASIELLKQVHWLPIWSVQRGLERMIKSIELSLI